MRDVYDFAKFFIKNGADSTPDTYDGNMKLQKLLVLADLASISEFGEPLFNDEILAFENGCVIEKVRLRYKNDYSEFKQESVDFQPDFSDVLTDEIISKLEKFSSSAEDDSYTIYLDNGNPVIY